MSGEDQKETKGSKFLKKSKWGKILKEKESDSSNGSSPVRQGTFTLNDDVVDFLKPSTEKRVPKIDIAIAKRWPEAHAVDQASPLPGHTTYTKPKRRKGLTVSFVRTPPEIIGEGGDEAPDPTREISRQKAALQRSISDRKPGLADFGRQGPRSQPIPQQLQQQGAAPPPEQYVGDDDFVPLPVRRVQTSHNEFSPAMQRKVASPPSGDVEQYQSSLGRQPTTRSGFKSDHFGHTSPIETPVEAPAQYPVDYRQNERPNIDTRFGQHTLDSLSGPSSDYSRNSAGLSPLAALSPVVQKRREMSKSEGMVFRRASMLMTNDEDDDDDESSPPQNSYQQHSYTALQPEFSAGNTQHEMFSSPSNSSLTAETATSPDGPNPFADPNYIKRHSQEFVPQANAQQSQYSQASSLRQTTKQAPPHQASDPYQYQQGTGSQEPIMPSSQGRIYQRQDRRVPQIAQPYPGHHRASSRDEQQSGISGFPSGTAAQPSHQQQMRAPTDSSRDRSKSPAVREHSSDAAAGLPEKTRNLYIRPNGSFSSVNRLSPNPSQSQSNSRDGYSALSAGSGPQQALSPQSAQFYDQPHQERGSKTSILGASRAGPSPNTHGAPAQDYFDRSRAVPPVQPARSPVAQIQQEHEQRPSPSNPSNTADIPPASPVPLEYVNPAADAAYADFAGRVAHMRGVFRLTAEKEQVAERSTPRLWLRAGLWWLLQGKCGLEVLLNQRNPNQPKREMLVQAHVDLAKSWWILTDQLEPDESAGRNTDEMISRGVPMLRGHIKSISLAMGKSRLLPPTQSLIQGQDTRIWLEYPNFTAGAAAILGGITNNSGLLDETQQRRYPFDLLPPSDSPTAFCYGRFAVDVFVNTENSNTDRITLPCMLTVLRRRRDYQTSIVIASQSELVSVTVCPRQSDSGDLTWANVSWKASSHGMIIHLPHNFDLSLRMHERDFRAVWNLSEYARKVENDLRAGSEEQFVHEARLVELQYADSSNSPAFPADKIRGCSMLIFERSIPFSDGNGLRKLHRGYRMLLITDPSHKTLSSVSHEVCRKEPLYFEYLTDSTANGTTAMVIRIREEKKQCRILLVFPDMASRQMLYDVLNGLKVGSAEAIVGRMTLTDLSIVPASQSGSIAMQVASAALQGLQWQKLGVTNTELDDPNSRFPNTVQSESLRIMARHSAGCITDRMNLGKGEMLLRLPTSDLQTMQVLRAPQEDLSMSIDTRHAPQQVCDGIGRLLHTAVNEATIRTFTFATPSDLQAFQAAITGCTVRYDGIASTLGISRRMMVVPIYKKLEASKVRLQLVSKDTVVQLLAFMEDFAHADALCFQVKSTDTFEGIKGDGRHKKWGVRLVDAKFSLPHVEKGEESEDSKLKRRFVNLEGLEYAEEHDDITIGFETEQDRDVFSRALPAATSVSRGITLKRRI